VAAAAVVTLAAIHLHPHCVRGVRGGWRVAATAAAVTATAATNGSERAAASAATAGAASEELMCAGEEHACARCTQLRRRLISLSVGPAHLNQGSGDGGGGGECESTRGVLTRIRGESARAQSTTS